ncbi:helix-turn-helix domain-containing protein [Neomicrococcus lactis]|uniref:DNA-binding NarL/FixJ family response regulator n=1 Tax=Neomicrococcus lactis TaxID=732241 RepID=A0A7W8YBK3_9MICC|nr:DNA-binding NarL/FixJ family response regulator [Neomicrococcus lactis]
MRVYLVKCESYLVAKALFNVATDDRVEGLSCRGEDERLFDRLSPSEKSVLNFMADGLANETIAGSLNLSSPTVESHVRAILSKIVSVPEESMGRRVCAVPLREFAGGVYLEAT